MTLRQCSNFIISLLLSSVAPKYQGSALQQHNNSTVVFTLHPHDQNPEMGAKCVQNFVTMTIGYCAIFVFSIKKFLFGDKLNCALYITSRQKTKVSRKKTVILHRKVSRNLHIFIQLHHAAILFDVQKLLAGYINSSDSYLGYTEQLENKFVAAAGTAYLDQHQSSDTCSTASEKRPVVCRWTLYSLISFQFQFIVFESLSHKCIRRWTQYGVKYSRFDAK